MIESHIYMQEVIHNISSFKIGIYFFKKLYPVFTESNTGLVFTGFLQDESYDIPGNFSTKMKPINSPGIIFGGAIFMGSVSRYHNELRRINIHFLTIHFNPSTSFSTINQYVLTNACFSLHIMIPGLWKITNASNKSCFVIGCFAKIFTIIPGRIIIRCPSNPCLFSGRLYLFAAYPQHCKMCRNIIHPFRIFCYSFSHSFDVILSYWFSGAPFWRSPQRK
ncbi:MAG: hypothetical protein JWP81_5404 [Ferruginibacter sp.]|nr:hypothetical protein [Ferruginibacter sp.]